MRKGLLLFTLVTVLSCTSQPGQSQDTEAEPDGGKIESHAHEVSLLSLLDHVEGYDGSDFLVAGGVPEQVAIGHWEERELSYPELLSVLNNNGLAAVRSDGKVNIVLAHNVRSYPVAHATEHGDRTIPGNEWVTHVIPVPSRDSRQLVPVLRPMVSQQGHLATVDSDALIIVDHHANVRRIETLIEALAPTEGE